LSGPAAALPEYVASPDWQCIDFISDLHLSADTPRTVEAWASHLLRTPAGAVFMLGDVFEAWVGDDACASGFERNAVDALRRASAARSLTFMAGNRDFLLGAAALRQGGVAQLADPTVLVAFGRRVLLTHGDALCLADTDYQRFRAEIRSAAWQERFLALPLVERRRIAKSLRDASENRKRALSPDDWADIDSDAAARWMEAASAGVLVHGHTHRPSSGAFAPGCVRHVLSDWDLDTAARAEVLRYSAAGFERVPPA